MSNDIAAIPLSAILNRIEALRNKLVKANKVAGLMGQRNNRHLNATLDAVSDEFNMMFGVTDNGRLSRNLEQ